MVVGDVLPRYGDDAEIHAEGGGRFEDVLQKTFFGLQGRLHFNACSTFRTPYDMTHTDSNLYMSRLERPTSQLDERTFVFTITV